MANSAEDTFRDMKRKSIAQQAQEKQGLHAAFADERISLKVGSRSYRFMTWCGCGHLHLIADGGAILEVCGGDCVAHPYALRQQGTQATIDVTLTPGEAMHLADSAQAGIEACDVYPHCEVCAMRRAILKQLISKGVRTEYARYV